MFGGRIAEELIFGPENVTTGASNDIMQATGLARRMVTEWGMSEKLGPIKYSDNEEEVFLGHSVTQRKNMSDRTASLIDEETRRLVEESEVRARAILTGNIDQLHKLAAALLEYETLSREDIDRLLRGEPIRVGGDTTTPPKARSSVPTSGTPAYDDKGHPTGMEPKPQPGS